MHLIPREIDKLVISQVGILAQRRLANGIVLNSTEAVGLISHQLQEMIRTGLYSVADLMAVGKEFLGRRHVLASVPHVLTEIQVEGTFPQGTYLVTVHNPICTDEGNLEKALWGSFLPIPSMEKFPGLPTAIDYAEENQPGAVVTLRNAPIEINKGKRKIQLKVTNKGDRPIQVGSHYHFIEANKSLVFDRGKAYGMRLDIISGTAIRFEPGDSKTVTLVEISGKKTIYGGSNIASGPVSMDKLKDILTRVHSLGFGFKEEEEMESLSVIKPFLIDRSTYAYTFGPTVGDTVRLGDTELWVKVEKDYTFYGDEVKFGGGKVLRDGMAQASGRTDRECLDMVITNALIIDYTGIYKADIGIKNGIIVGIGKSGNPDTMDGICDNMICGMATDVIAGEKHIITAGGVDTHIHFLCPQQVPEAAANGITTMIGGGTGPSTGSNATTCTPSINAMRQMLQSADHLSMNIGLTGKGNDSRPDGFKDVIQAGAIGLKMHEDWGTTPAVIDTCLEVCDKYDVQALIHTDTLNESSFVDDTVAAFKGRTIHTYHTEGAGGGHAPDILSVVELENVLPSSTNPTRPFTSNTLDEHLDMLMVCHHLSKNIPEDVAFAESRIRAETIAAEDILHDTGAISMMSSDSQAMGRCGEVVLRTWKTASKNKEQRGPLPEEPDPKVDNFRVKRYISKYTINPAITHGISHLVGSIEIGKVADLVIWPFESFGAKPSLVLKSGMISYAIMGDANASIPTIQPLILRPMYAAMNPETSITFVSQLSLDSGTVQKYGLKKRLEPVKNTRRVTKRDMKYNDAMPKMKIDPESYKVYADGELCTCEPSDKLPLSTKYFLY